MIVLNDSMYFYSYSGLVPFGCVIVDEVNYFDYIKFYAQPWFFARSRYYVYERLCD